MPANKNFDNIVEKSKRKKILLLITLDNLRLPLDYSLKKALTIYFNRIFIVLLIFIIISSSFSLLRIIFYTRDETLNSYEWVNITLGLFVILTKLQPYLKKLIKQNKSNSVNDVDDVDDVDS